MPKSNAQECRELYSDDPYVTDYWYGKIMEDAIERDLIDALLSENPTDSDYDA